MTRPHRLVESFAPEILATLLRGATGPVELEMPYKIAVRFRLRIHQLREAMRLTGHEKYRLVSRVGVTIEYLPDEPTTKQGRHWIPINRDAPCRVTVRPNDTEFTTILTDAGIDISLAADVADPLPTEERHDAGVLEEMLKSIGGR